ncbi:hypothetical protein KV134_08550 [Tetragenococcus halophilus]|uniref:Group-specific protein n=1 Tax=Tetragenococcus halophilus (strain DSM 20338 / JCM 20259 / NCIMB 9735 / NBRC 12172) TaxID=945021 RepID=A0AAN1SFS9_TETHN|nr:hypothetical protein [Tetragenococcus halophilus]NWO00897.1 group-specific protein [Tetragenococcus halophilus]QXN86257.1 hypothetical protein KV134_08550 [Tetragenococcus halophilus]RQD29200.1 group-specific protein [Tetragenococcus halophilus subsp. halophilus DSM 20339]WJS81343.1 hypothetical protein KFZ55_08660 [Tetragenococcus halophilus]BAK94238.1 hypothetical protein TEH_09110 [Tetragenococcus halophilus NBRC 12172]
MSEIDFLNIQINEEALESQIIEQIKLKIKAFDDNKIFYDLDDLVTITSFSKGHIMNTFFNDPRFRQIRRRVGRKWVFPVQETNTFLKQWILEQPNE